MTLRARGGAYKTEEDVRIKFLLPFLKERGYKESHVRFEQGVEVQEGRKRKTIYADAVVYSSARADAPLVLCETKAPNEVLDRRVKEQAISYARLLPRIAPLVLITNGLQVQVFQTLNKNRIAELPPRSELHRDVVNFVVSEDLQAGLREEAKHDLFIIDDVQTFKRVLRACHNEIRNNEGSDPAAAFDEMSTVLFCKLYEEKTHPNNNRFRTSVFDDTLDRVGVNVVRQIFEETKQDANYADLFVADATIDLQDRTVRRIVELFEDYDLSLTGFDVKGEAFEYFLSDTFTGGLGEYFTPRNVVEFMVDAVDPKIGEKTIDPFCGTGGFLIYAFEVVGEKIRLQEFSEEEKARWRLELSERSLYGTDWKERTSQACKMNMMVHGDGSAGIEKHHGLIDVDGKIGDGLFDLCVTNPPFGAVENDPAILERYELGQGRKSQDRMVLAVERALRLVKPGGTVAIVLADGLLDNTSTAYVREYIKANAWVRAVISLVKETFEGYGSRAKTSILFLEKKEGTDEGEQEPVFMAVAENTGYAPNGAQVPGNQLPDILIDWRAFKRAVPDLSSHGDSWVVEIGDRLDAKFYRRRAGRQGADLTAIREDVQTRLRETQVRYDHFAVRLDTAFENVESHRVHLGDLLVERRAPEPVDPESPYRLLGVRWWGEGTFIREEKLGKEIKAKTFHRVAGGSLIYNRLFAYRGSFAILPEEHEDCYVSNEFPMFVANETVESPELVLAYIAHTLNSPQYLELVDALSTGSTKTSRNRFSQTRFLQLEIELPIEGLEEIVAVLDEVAALKRQQEELLGLMKEMREGVALMLPMPADEPLDVGVR